MAVDGPQHDIVDHFESLRQEMVNTIVEQRTQLGVPVPKGVEAALRTVPRHCFVPDVSAQEAYVDDAVITKRDENNLAMSSVSQPTIIAMMLGQLEAKPGHRVLEIGSGGYNAALLRELVGPDGRVTTMDIDSDVVERARMGLAAAGYHDVEVLLADGELGAEASAPFDRIIVTVQAADVPRAWMAQLAAGGRLVLPLRILGLTRSLALDKEDGHLVSRGYEICGFVPMQGAGERSQHQVLLHDMDVALRIDNPALHVQAGLLREAMAQPARQVWTGVTVGSMEPFDDQDLWLACALPQFCLITATREAIDAGLVSPTWRLGTPALVDGGSFAYRTIRKIADEQDQHEFGVIGHGPGALIVAERLAEQMRLWDRQYRSGPGPVFRVYPQGTPDDRLANGFVIEKDHTRVSISWP